MKRVKLHLTGVGETLTQAAEKKLETGEDYQVPTCKNGLTEEQYIDLGVKLPEDLIKKIKQQEKGVELKEEDFEDVYSDVSVYAEDILLMVSDEDLTTIFLRDSDIRLTVLETVDEIDDYISYLSLNSFQKWWLVFKVSFLNFFRGKNKLEKQGIEFKIE